MLVRIPIQAFLTYGSLVETCVACYYINHLTVYEKQLPFLDFEID